MPLSNAKFVAVDLETTGVDPSSARIIEIGIVSFSREKGIEERWGQLLNPGVPVPFPVLALTGIEADELEAAPSFEAVKQEVAERLSVGIAVGQSVDFDLAMLREAGAALPPTTLDTWHLASIFLPGLPSYRLEAIAASLGVELPEAHRAVPDAEATARVLLKLLERIEEGLSPKLYQELGTILARSEYGLQEIWPRLRPKGNRPIAPTRRAEEEIPPPNSAVQAFIKEVRESPASHRAGIVSPECPILPALKAVLEAGSPEDPLMVAVPTLGQAKQLSQALPGSSLALPPDHYLSTARLTSFLESPRFSEREVVLALRLRLFREWGSGRRDELALFDADYRLFELLSCRGLSEDELADEPYYGGAREALTTTRICIAPHRSLPHLDLPRDLIISDFQIFDEAATAALSRRIDQRDGEGLPPPLDGEFDFVIGLLGIVLEQFRDPGDGEATLRILPIHFRSKQWQQFAEVAQRFISAPLPAAATTLQAARVTALQRDLGEILRQVETEIVWIRYWKGVLSLHLAPHSVEPLLAEIGEGRRVLLLGKARDGVPSDYEIRAQPPLDARPRVEIFRGLGDEESAVQAMAALVSESDSDRVGVFCSSNTLVRDLYEPLSEAVSREVLAEGVSGSSARVIEDIRDRPEGVLLAGPRLWDRPGLEEWFDLIIVPRLSFDIPSDPLHEARAAAGGGFQGYNLPRATARLRALLGKLKPEGRLALLDSRLISRSYGKELVERLGLTIEYRDFSRS